MTTPVFIIIFVITFIISFLWMRGIDNMKRKHPDYKGEDFLDWDKNNEDEK